jgi:hypothetical protein
MINRCANPAHNTHSCCWEGVFTASLHSNGTGSIVACVFVTAGMRLSSLCLVMNVYSDFTIPAFGRHVVICLKYSFSNVKPISCIACCLLFYTHLCVE